MTVKQYLADPALTGSATVTEIGVAPLPYVRLQETWFYAQGGGQKGDRGSIGTARVLDTKPGPNGTVDHFVDSIDGLQEGGTYNFMIDADWRVLGSRLHSAGHLIAGVVEELVPGSVALAGHHWPGEGRVDFDMPAGATPPAEDVIQAAAAQTCADDLQITIEGDPFSSRSCRVGPYNPIPCGGTHVSSTRKIGSIKIRSVKMKSGKLRVGYDL